ncbi:MAG: response regulator [Burkholderiales bacterium]|nr:response regulator [Phycisphaerae bacterium]
MTQPEQPGGPPAGARPAPARKVLIVEDETLVGIGLKAHLEKLGHNVVGQADDAAQALAMFTQHSPDLVLMDIRLDNGASGDQKGDDGIDLSTKLLAIRRVPIVIISAYSEDALHARAAAAGVFGYLVKPVTREALAAQIAVVLRRFTDTETLRDERDTATQSLETRKLVDRAKGILMKRLSLDEPAAHKRLQSESQKRRVSIGEIAKKVIESEKLLGG